MQKRGELVQKGFGGTPLIDSIGVIHDRKDKLKRELTSKEFELYW